MGFGILFFGYLIGINTVAFPGFFKILSYLVMLRAATRFARFNRHLTAAYYTLIPATIVGAFYLFIEAGSLFSLFTADIEALLFRIVPLAAAAFELLFLMRLLKGLQELAVETEVKILEIASFRNRIFTFVYYLLYILGQLEYPESMTVFLNYYAFAVILIGLVIMLMNAKLFYNFYMWICLPDDIEMQRKPSRFALVERVRTHLDGIEERQLARQREKAEEERKKKEKRRKEKRKKK